MSPGHIDSFNTIWIVVHFLKVVDTVKTRQVGFLLNIGKNKEILPMFIDKQEVNV